VITTEPLCCTACLLPSGISLMGYDVEWFRETWKDRGLRLCLFGRTSRGKTIRYDKRRYRRRNRIRSRAVGRKTGERSQPTTTGVPRPSFPSSPSSLASCSGFRGHFSWSPNQFFHQHFWSVSRWISVTIIASIESTYTPKVYDLVYAQTAMSFLTSVDFLPS